VFLSNTDHSSQTANVELPAGTMGTTSNLFSRMPYTLTISSGALTLTGSMTTMAVQVYKITGGAPDTQAPSIPTGLTSSSVAQTSFTLSWTASTDNVGVTGYEVFKDGVSVGTTASTSMNISGLTCNTTYVMTVKARDAVPNWSAASTPLNVTTSACGGDTRAPTIPTDLTSSSITTTSFSLS